MTRRAAPLQAATSARRLHAASVPCVQALTGRLHRGTAPSAWGLVAPWGAACEAPHVRSAGASLWTCRAIASRPRETTPASQLFAGQGCGVWARGHPCPRPRWPSVIGSAGSPLRRSPGPTTQRLAGLLPACGRGHRGRTAAPHVSAAGVVSFRSRPPTDTVRHPPRHPQKRDPASASASAAKQPKRPIRTRTVGGGLIASLGRGVASGGGRP